MRKTHFLTDILVPGLLLAFLMNAQGTFSRAEEIGVYISEVSAAGDDWIELHNGGEAPVDLAGWVLSDKKHPEVSSPEHSLLLSGTLAPGGYTVFKELPFGISAGGEKLYLFDPTGGRADAFECCALKTGHSAGRLPGSDGCTVFETPTPGEENGSGYTGYAPAPEIDDTALFRAEPFTLTVYGDADIRYTLDGSVPTEESEKYGAPLVIKKNTVLRARAFREGCLPSDTVTVTYLFEEEHAMPAVTLAMDPDEWEKLRVSKTKDPEVEASVSYYEADGTPGVSFPAGINVRGNASRKNAHKSFGVHLRSRYGQKSVTYPFWGEGTALEYSNLTLRSGSQDQLKARMRDSFAIRACAALKVDKVQTRFVLLYVNGEYYGLADLNEGMNQDYVKAHYGIDGDTVNIIEWNDDVSHGSGEGLKALRKFVSEHSLKDDKNYAAFCEMIDVDAFTDYLIAETFFCNGDYHNLMYWGTDDGSFPYRPVLYDMDNILLEGNSHYNNMGKFFAKGGFKYGPNNKYYVDTGLFYALRQNESWRRKFTERYAYLLCNDFSVQTLETLFDEMIAEMEPEMPRNIKKWNQPSSVSAWKKQTDILRQQISLRHEKIQTILRGEFDISKADWTVLMQKYGAEQEAAG